MNKAELEQEAKQRVDAVWEDPEGRLAMRVAFYEKYPGVEVPPHGYGNSEISFLKWEIKRGVLAPTDAETPGSAWWKSVNGDFLYNAELASLAFEHQATNEEWPLAVRHWLDYIETPTPTSWYIAHNTSIIQGYLDNVSQARVESDYEQQFINIVLYRLLYAQAMVMDATLFGKLGGKMADPSGHAVELIVSLDDFYPTEYPLSYKAYEQVMGQCFGLEEDAVRILDDIVILPHLDELYREAAKWNHTPRLVRLTQNDVPTYPKDLLPPPRPEGPKKIAILGGGISALATAWELTSYPGWQTDYDITLYQLGWRCGGKMRGGRGPHGRVEELGLHLLLGFYVNAFPFYQEAYAERTRRGLAPESPYKQLTDAIKPNNSTLLVNYDSDDCNWQNWPLIFPPSEGYPGDGPPLNTWQLLHRGMGILFETLLGSPYAEHVNPIAEWILGHYYPPETSEEPTNDNNLERNTPPQGWAERIRQHIGAEIDKGIHKLEEWAMTAVKEVMDGLGMTLRLPKKTLEEAPLHVLNDLLYYLQEFGSILWTLIDNIEARHQRLHHLAMLFDFGVAAVKGMLNDVWNPTTHTFEYRKINHLDFRAWLRSHGAHEETLYSPVVTFFYTGTYEALDDNEQQGGLLAAGTALQFAIPALGYKGAFCFQLKLGTADTLVMPVYQVLQARGVKFQFFHNVTNIACDDTQDITRIDLDRQVDLIDDTYDPITWVKGNPAWPQHPLYNQINPTQAKELIERNIDLEDPWSGWTGTPVSLHVGKDFDDVVLAIPPKAQASICKEIIAARPDWGEMVEKIGSAQVMSTQLWFSKDIEELGFRHQEWGLSNTDNAANVVTYANPLFSWLDQTDIIENEDWPEDMTPKMLAMFTGILPPPFFGPTGDVDPTYMEAQKRRVLHMSWQWLMDNMGFFFRDARPPAYPSGLDLQTLQGTEPGDLSGQDKFMQQFFTCAIAPSDQYVIAIPNTEQYRKKPGGSGFNNLFLTGDWTDYGTNIGYMEGCVVSAHKAVEAIMSQLGREQLRPYWKDELADWD